MNQSSKENIPMTTMVARSYSIHKIIQNQTDDSTEVSCDTFDPCIPNTPETKL